MSTLPSITAEELRQIRAELDLTQARFGDLMGVSRLTVWKWENDHIKRDNGAVAQLARLYRTLFRLGVSTDQLLAGVEGLDRYLTMHES